MTIHEIQDLLQRFYDGQTTEAEESTLRNYFASEIVPEELANDKALFNELENLAHSEEVPQWDARHLEQAIDQWDTVAISTRRRTTTISLKWAAGIAACLLLFMVWPKLTIMVEQRQEEARALAQKESQNPEQAAQEAIKALQKFSDCLNKSIAIAENNYNKTFKNKKTKK